MPISSKVASSELRSWHDSIDAKLAERDLHTLSYNTDGASVERTVSRSLQSDAAVSHNIHEWSFPHPRPGRSPLVFQAIRSDSGKPQIIINDGKHWRKNARNGAQSGGRIVTLGRYIVHIGQLVAIVEDDISPLLKTDVLGVDKQDDRAAARLMSADVIEHLAKTQPDELGLIIYLFIMGELIDAQQNRTLKHEERIQMLLRGHFFLEGWRMYISTHSFFSINTHFISYPLYEVLNIYIRAMIMLVLAHRDFFPDIPLLPWLHSTETCEHFFGCARKIKSDFTFAEFILMVPKLSILVAAESNSRAASAQARSSEGRAGYCHTWFDSKGVDPVTLAKYPSDEKINTVAQTAYEEASSLLRILGMDEATLLDGVDARAFHDSLQSFSDLSALDEDNDMLEDLEEGSERLATGNRLADILRADAEDVDSVSSSCVSDKKMTRLGIAAAATKVHDVLEMYAFIVIIHSMTLGLTIIIG